MIWELAFAQPNVVQRLALVRVTLGVTVFALVCSPGFGSFFVRMHHTLSGRATSASSLRAFTGIRVLTIGLAALLVSGAGGAIGTAALLLCFALLDRYVARVTPRVWFNNFHVHYLLFAVFVTQACETFGATPKARSIESFMLTSMQLQAGSVYLLSGISKLRVGGLEWFATGRTLFAGTIFRGTRLGRFLVCLPGATRGIAFMTIVFELGAPMLILWPSSHVWFAAIAIAFHLGVLAVMRISFWHLWVFFPALFVIQ